MRVSRRVMTPWGALAVTLVGLLLFFAVRNGIHIVLRHGEVAQIGAVFMAAAAFAVAFCQVGYGNAAPLLRRLTRCSVLGVLAYLLVEPPEITVSDPTEAELAGLLDALYWPAVASAAVAVLRPSFAVFPVILMLATRETAQRISGFTLSSLDIRYMAEMTLVLAASLSIIGGSGRRLASEFRDHLAQCSAFVAIGLHLANYFWSGVAKLWIGPAPWSWLLENETPHLMLVALDRGVLPTGAIPWLTQVLYDGFLALYPISNAFVLVTQLAAILVVLRLAWLRWATLAYDALHLGIWVLGGLFFWPWVWNNLSVLLGLAGMRDERIGLAPKIACIVTILLGVHPWLGGAIWLAWWDVPDLKHGRFEVRTNTYGPWIPVPVSFWLSHSYAVSHGYQDLARTEGHYPPTIWGSAYDHARAQAAGTCPNPASFPMESLETAEQRADRLDRVGAFVRAHHQKMRLRQDRVEGIFGLPAFYLRSHHHPSIPSLHEDFNAINLDDVTQYRLVTRSVCLSLHEGRLTQRVLKEDDVVYDIR